MGHVLRCGSCQYDAKEMEMLDYCAACLTDLCGDCMVKGHCGNVPARSGLRLSYEEEKDGR